MIMNEPDQLLDTRLMLMREQLRRLTRSVADERSQSATANAIAMIHAALELLDSAHTALHEQQNQQRDVYETRQREFDRYQSLFQDAPCGYLITSIDGTIHQLNQRAAAIFGAQPQRLIGRSLTFFTPEGRRRELRALITELTTQAWSEGHGLTLVSLTGEMQSVQCWTSAVHGPSGRVVQLRWILVPDSS